ncbi:molybdenum cofactor biosynthesis prote [Testicularia cyperi]|uniref:Molybdenum cofactor biosynthesis prote n=1 Tax=Testicularia cyperi TaxID=1882483 RepID=A0A317XYJ2_9BASI|nr:molybdenum cofactor biosynthesis prote [Testicularia cyperi]
MVLVREAIAGPSRLASTPLLRSSSSTTSARRYLEPKARHLFSSATRRKPLATTPITSSSGGATVLPPAVASTSSASSSAQLRARQRISDIDAVQPSPFLRDRHHRQHTYLRISLTEKCNLRCLYCMPEDGVPLTPASHLLSTEEVQRLASLFVSQGVTKIRLTGGEPTIRQDLPQIISSLSQLKQHGLEQIGITTNGIALGRRKLDTLVANGLTHLNVSLDTLDPFKFEFMTRRRGHEAVVSCIERALDLGVQSVKINVVVIKGLNDTQDVLDFVRFTKDKRITIRFIEYMPFDGNKWQVTKLVPYQDLVGTIQREFPTFARLSAHDDANDTSKHWHVPGHEGKVGFITSMTDNFCGTCNRIRVTADGNLKVCLFGNAEVSLRDAMREGFGPISPLIPGSDGKPATDEQLLHLIGAAVGRKHAKHAGMKDPTELAKSLNPSHPAQPFRLRSSFGRGRSGLLSPRARTFGNGSMARSLLHTSAVSRRHSKVEEDEDEDDNPWGDLDKAFDNLQNKSLYHQVYHNRPESASGAPEARSGPEPVTATTDRPSSGRDRGTRNPITDMEEAIFAQAGAAAIRSAPEPRTTTGPIGAVRFSDSPPSMSSSLTSAPPTFGGSAAASGMPMGMQHQRWSEYMQQEAGVSSSSGDGDDDSPWASLDAFVDNPDASAEYAVPLQQLQQQQQHYPSTTRGRAAVTPTVDPRMLSRASSAGEGILTASEEAMFAQAGAAAIDNIPALQSNPAASLQQSASGRGGLESDRLTHIDPRSGRASMVDVGSKPATARTATAVGRVYMPRSAAHLIRATEAREGVAGKGSVLQTAQLAGIMGAKRTSDLIPLCHPLALAKVDVKLEILDVDDEIEVTCTAKTTGQTGVEMEALTGCTTACLTVWDMAKAVAGQTMSISQVRVTAKAGGKSGDWSRA